MGTGRELRPKVKIQCSSSPPLSSHANVGLIVFETGLSLLHHQKCIAGFLEQRNDL